MPVITWGPRMDGETGGRLLNTNPLRFEELAGAIATAYAYLDEGRAMDKLLDDLQHLYRRALDQPPCYTFANSAASSPSR